MASENETVEEIVNETKFTIDYGNGVLLDLAGKQAVDILDRIEVAHRRAVDVVLKDRDEMFKSEQDTVAKTKEWFDENQKLKLEVAELKSKMNDVVCENEALRDACGTCGAKREVDELRECLEQAYGDKIGTYTMKGNEIERWRKALKEAKDESK